MANSKIYRGKTVNEAIQLALNELNVTRSEIDVEVVNQPKEYLFGMIRTFAVVKVTLKETAQMSLEPEIVPGAGLVGVENGKLVYTPPRDGGAPPRILFDNTIIVYYNGKQAKNAVTLEEGLEPLDIQLPNDHQPSTDIEIEISEDKLEALLRVRRIYGVTRRLKDCKPANIIELSIEEVTIPAPKATLTEIREKVNKAGIVYGIDYDVITNELLEENDFEVVIARGQEPIYPRHGAIDYLFPLTSGQREIDLEADRIDHFELNIVPNVEKGQPLATKTAPVHGQPGKNIFGKVINVGEPKNPEIQIGEGVVLSEDGLTAYADQPGRPVLENGVLKVLKIYELNKDVDLSTGNIRFNGEIIIRGNVTEQLKVEAFSGGIQIYGMVTQAQIQASRDIVISKNAISSKISAGGDAIAFLKLSSFLNELTEQVSSLLSAFYTVIKRQPETSHGRVVKNLLEIKYTDLPKKIQEFDHLFSEGKDIFENGLFLLINNMKAVFLGRGPLELIDISTVEIIRSDLLHWKEFYQHASEETADITVSYLQNSTLEASGSVRVIGQGAYYSKIIAGQGYYQTRGVFRGGEIVVEEGDIQVKELGGPTGIVTVASIVRNGRMSIGLVHPNVTVAIGNQKYRFENQTSMVRVYLSNEGLEVFSGSASLLR